MCLKFYRSDSEFYKSEIVILYNCSSIILCVVFLKLSSQTYFWQIFKHLFRTRVAGGDVTKLAISQNVLPESDFLASNDVELMSGKSCQVSCRYRLGFRSYSGKLWGGGVMSPQVVKWYWPGLRNIPPRVITKSDTNLYHSNCKPLYIFYISGYQPHIASFEIG